MREFVSRSFRAKRDPVSSRPRAHRSAARSAAAVNNFDLIRLVAATEVAVKHGLVHLGLGGGWLEHFSVLPGVPVFFLISGFLIFQSYRNSNSLGDFALNRAVRIFHDWMVEAGL